MVHDLKYFKNIFEHTICFISDNIFISDNKRLLIWIISSFLYIKSNLKPYYLYCNRYKLDFNKNKSQFQFQFRNLTFTNKLTCRLSFKNEKESFVIWKVLLAESSKFIIVLILKEKLKLDNSALKIMTSLTNFLQILSYTIVELI